MYKKSYGEKDGRVGMAMCSLANAKCTKGGLLLIYTFLIISCCGDQKSFVEECGFSQQAMQMER